MLKKLHKFYVQVTSDLPGIVTFTLIVGLIFWGLGELGVKEFQLNGIQMFLFTIPYGILITMLIEKIRLNKQRRDIAKREHFKTAND